MEQMIGAVIPWGINGTARDDPYMDLASAVVAQAAKDYIKILRKLWKKDIAVQARRGLFLGKLDLESFFHSAWYEMLTDVDPDFLLSKCNSTALEQEKEFRRKQAEKRSRRLVDKQKNTTTEQEEKVHETGQSITRGAERAAASEQYETGFHRSGAGVHVRA